MVPIVAHFLTPTFIVVPARYAAIVLCGKKGKAMTDKARTELKRKDWVNVRSMILTCCGEILQSYESNRCPDDATSLRALSKQIDTLVENFEEKSGTSINMARSGKEWAALKKLSEDIAASLQAEKEREGDTKKHVARGGCKTEALVTLALQSLGGPATTAEIQDWVDRNKDVNSVKATGAHMNENATSSFSRPEGTPIWKITVASCLSSSAKFVFNRDSRKWCFSSDAGRSQVHEGDKSKRRRLSE